MKTRINTHENQTQQGSASLLPRKHKGPTTKNANTREVPDKIYKIAEIIRNDWKNIYFGAIPYLDAMGSIEDIHGDYYEDSAKTIVSYFLANAQAWRGDTARVVKAKLKALISQTK